MVKKKEKVTWKEFKIIDVYKSFVNGEKCDHCGRAIKNICVIQNELGHKFNVGETCAKKVFEENNLKNETKEDLITHIIKNFTLLKQINKAEHIFYNDQYFIISNHKKKNGFDNPTFEFLSYPWIDFKKLIKLSVWKWIYNKGDSLLELLQLME